MVWFPIRHPPLKSRALQNSHDYAEVMFSARLFADTDVNWKNFLGRVLSAVQSIYDHGKQAADSR